MRAVVALLALAGLACSSSSGGAAPAIDAGGGANTRPSESGEESRAQVEMHIQALAAAATVEEENEAVAEFAMWLEQRQCCLDLEPIDGADFYYECRCFPPVVPWGNITFLDPANADLLACPVSDEP